MGRFGSGWVVPIVVAVALCAGLTSVTQEVLANQASAAAPPVATGAALTAPAPAGCHELVVSTSPDMASTLQVLAGRFNSQPHKVAGSCAWITLNSQRAGEVAWALAAGWDEATNGRRPSVWVPASSAWARLASHDAVVVGRPDPIPSDSTSLATTPLVLAMPQPMAEALGWPERSISWDDLAWVAQYGWGSVGHPEWGAFNLGKTNPKSSTSGLHATIGLYYTANDERDKLTVDQVTTPASESFMRALESRVVHYGDTSSTFLQNMRHEADSGRAMSYVSGVIVEEKSVVDYNRGNPAGDPNAEGQMSPPEVPLAAVYPSEGAMVSDNPWLVLRNDWVTYTDRALAAYVLSWLQEPAQQQALVDAGYRAGDGTPGSSITEGNGVLPDQPSRTLPLPTGAVIDAVEKAWDERLRKNANVLLLMDVSGSMAEYVPSVGRTKLRLAQEAASSAIGGLAPDDQIGLWVFATETGDELHPWQELQPPARAKHAIPAMREALAVQSARGGTALYETLRAAHQRMTETLDPSQINAIIVLSDGRNENPHDDDLPSLLAELRGRSTEDSVRVFTIGYGESSDPGTLKAIAEASRGGYYEATDPTAISDVLVSVLSNF